MTSHPVPLPEGMRRSNLESRWSNLFDYAEIEFEYEPEHIRKPGQAYWPDFWLPRYDLVVEVKGDMDVDSAIKCMSYGFAVARAQLPRVLGYMVVFDLAPSPARQPWIIFSAEARGSDPPVPSGWWTTKRLQYLGCDGTDTRKALGLVLSSAKLARTAVELRAIEQNELETA